MWRMWNNITRAFRTHVYSPRPSAGVLVEDEKELQEKQGHTVQSFCHSSENVKNQDCNRDEQCDCQENSGREWRRWNNINGGDNKERQKTFNHDFWHLLLCSKNMFQTFTWGPVFIWGSNRENFKQKTSSSLLYQVLFALHGRITPATIQSVLPTIKEEGLDPCQPQPKQLAIKDAAGAALDQKINISKTETLELALKEFQKACYEYSARSESMQGLQAANGGDMLTAVEHLQRSCLLGNMSACFNLGLCYETGSGVPQDETKATYYYKKAAKGGHKMALYNLGLICMRHGREETSKENGEEGTNRTTAKKNKEGHHLNKEMGLDFLEEAAHLGLPEAQTYLGLYLMDECQEPARAVPYFKAAADQNDSEAQYLLAVCYEQGLGVEVNECLAARLYSLAAQTGHDLALYNLGVFNEEGLGGLPKNKETAMEMYRKAAKLGSIEAEERLEEILGPHDSDSPSTNYSIHQNDAENKSEKLPCRICIQNDKEDETDKQQTSLAYGNTAVENPFFSLLSPSASFPSLRSLPSISLPKAQVRPIRVSASQYPDTKLTVHDNHDSFRATTDKNDGFLGKVNFFLDMAPTAMTLDHDLNVPFGSLSKNFSPHPIHLTRLDSVDQGTGCEVQSLQRSYTFSDFSMIGI